MQPLATRPTSWATKTYQEIHDIAHQDGSILVVPVGSIEQHGYHMPVSTDSILADEIATLGAKRVMDSVPILTTPPVWSGVSPHHLSFGGTISLDEHGLIDILSQIAETALENGFDSLVLLNGHGGNSPVVNTATNTIGQAHPDVEVHALTYFELAADFYDEIRDTELGGASHAGEFETSLMLHLHPELVNTDRMEAPNLDEHYDLGGTDLLAGGPLTTYRQFSEYSDTGAIGNPSAGSAEKGELIYTSLGDELETLLREIHSYNT